MRDTAVDGAEGTRSDLIEQAVLLHEDHRTLHSYKNNEKIIHNEKKNIHPNSFTKAAMKR